MQNTCAANLAINVLGQQQVAALATLYVMVSDSKKLTKIGFTTKTVESRLAQHKVRYSDTRIVRQWPPCERGRKIETLAHKRLAYCHVHGEWFSCLPEDGIEAVCEAMQLVNNDEPLPQYAMAPSLVSGAAKRSRARADWIMHRARFAPVVWEGINAFSKDIYMHKSDAIHRLVVLGLTIVDRTESIGALNRQLRDLEERKKAVVDRLNALQLALHDAFKEVGRE